MPGVGSAPMVAAEAIASFEAALGFRPTDSLVLAKTHLTQSDNGLELSFGRAARIDIGAVATVGLLDHLRLSDGGEDGGWLAIYYSADEQIVAQARDHVHAAAGPGPVLDLVVADDRFRFYAEERAWSLELTKSTQAAAERAYAGKPLVPQADLTALPTITPAQARDMMSRMRQLETDATRPDGMEELARAALAAFRQAMAANRPAAAGDVAAVTLAIQSRAVRDAMCLSVIPGAGDLTERLLTNPGDSDAATARLADALIHRPSSPIEMPAAAIDLLRTSAAITPEGAREPALTVLAWTHLVTGDDARAARWARAATHDNPTATLPTLIADVLASPRLAALADTPADARARERRAPNL